MLWVSDGKDQNKIYLYLYGIIKYQIEDREWGIKLECKS